MPIAYVPYVNLNECKIRTLITKMKGELGNLDVNVRGMGKKHVT